MDKCTECKKTLLYSNEIERGLCYDCFSDFLSSSKKEEDEPDFEIKNDIAEIKATISTDQLVYTGSNKFFLFKQPKQYVFNPDARVKDYDKLLVFLLDNMSIYENAKGFEKVRYMFKEYRKEDK